MAAPSIAEYRRLTGYSRKTIDEKLSKLFGRAGARPSYHEFCQAIIADLSKTAGGRQAKEVPEGALDLEQQRARKEKAMADKIERENRLAEGEIVNADEVDRMNAEVDGSVRSGMLAIPSRLAAELSSLEDPREIQVVLDKEIRKALSELGTE